MPSRAKATDWTGALYVRLYRTLPADRPDVWEDDRALAWWVRLLYVADGAWPGPALLPRGLPVDLEDAFIVAEVIDRVGTGSYRFHGLDRLRGSAASLAVLGGKARAMGPRGEDGRYLPMAGPSRVVEPGGHMNGAEPPVAGPSRVDDPPVPPGVVPAGITSDEITHTDDERTSSRRSLSSSSLTTTARGWPPADCVDPEAHRPAHRRVPGLDAWRCLTCDEVAHEGLTFRERAGWDPGNDVTMSVEPQVEEEGPNGPF